MLQAAALVGSTCPAAGLAARTVPAAVHIDPAADRIDPVADRIDLGAARTGPVADNRWVGRLGSKVGRRRALDLRRSGLVLGTWEVRLGARPV
jgi:hypothetical protein